MFLADSWPHIFAAEIRLKETLSSTTAQIYKVSAEPLRHRSEIMMTFFAPCALKPDLISSSSLQIIYTGNLALQAPICTSPIIIS